MKQEYSDNEREFINQINIIAKDLNENAIKKGFWSEENNQAEKIALMHSELSEALEAIRHPNRADEHCPIFSNKVIELADCIIRILDFCYFYRLPIGEAILAKHEYNKTRPFKHGKAF